MPGENRIFLFMLLMALLSRQLQGQNDSPAVNRLNDRAQEISYRNTDSAVFLSEQALALAKKIKFEEGIARSEHSLGTFSYIESNYSKALEYYFTALSIWEKLERSTSNSPAGKRIMMLKSTTIGNIGNVYSDQGDPDKALEYYQEALKLDEQLDNQAGIARHLGNIGLSYWLKKDYSLALDYNLKALKKFEEQKNENGASITMANIGSIFHSNGNYSKALYYYSKALEIDRRLGRKYGIAANLGNMGSLYLQTKKFREAEEYLTQAISLCDSIRALDYLKEFEKTFVELDSTRGNFKGALMHYKKYIAAHDTIINDENVKKQTRLEMQFEFDKKQAADSVRVVEEKRVAAAELKAERNKRYSLYGGLLLVIVFAVFMYNRFRITQKQKRIIEEQKMAVEEQKKIVEEKQKDILDSIHYAQRIQKSLMPSEKYVEKALGRNRKSS